MAIIENQRKFPLQLGMCHIPERLKSSTYPPLTPLSLCVSVPDSNLKSVPSLYNILQNQIKNQIKVFILFFVRQIKVYIVFVMEWPKQSCALKLGFKKVACWLAIECDHDSNDVPAGGEVKKMPSIVLFTFPVPMRLRVPRHHFSFVKHHHNSQNPADARLITNIYCHFDCAIRQSTQAGGGHCIFCNVWGITKLLKER